jgi:predicted RNase H-like HicB family nuclease
MRRQLTAIIEREGNGYVSLCPEVDIASQGDTIEEARENLREALELFFETASPKEIETRLHKEVYVTRVDVAVGPRNSMQDGDVPDCFEGRLFNTTAL